MMKKILKFSNQGFTLLELLVVVALMGGLGLLFTDITTQALRNQNKTRIINQVKQNGQAVLDKLNTDIRQAQEVKCVSADTIIYTKLVSGQAGFTRIRFTAPDASKDQNGQLVIDYPVLADETTCAETNPQPINPQNLTDTDPVNGVSISNVSFAHTFTSSPSDSNDLFSDIVTIQFNITAGVQSGYAYETTVKDGGIPYSTTIQLRDLR